MLRRKMLDTLRSWRMSHGQECLLINGARQVGKSFIVERFGKEYQSFIKLDFIEHPDYKGIFAGSLSAEAIYSSISLYVPGARIVPGETLLFFDELQECPEARAAFKYLALDGRADVIGSGSLLGMRFRELADSPSLPVGYERQLTMRPLDFEEFLWALSYTDDAIDFLRGSFDRLEPIPSGIGQAMERRVREYLAIGGMPEVVQAFVGNLDFGAAHEVQTKLHDLYLDDVARYAPPEQRLKARACYLSLPRQLAKENTKFQYATVEKRGSARKFESAVDWLEGSEMVLRCRAVTTARYPLAAYEDESRYRLYANDTGLLMAMYDFGMKRAVVEDTLTGPMKGGLYENLIAVMLASNDVTLRYWMNSGGTREIEFLAERDGAIEPMEVKASRNRSLSLDECLQRDDVRVGYKLIDGNVGRVGKKVTLPHYLAVFAYR